MKILYIGEFNEGSTSRMRALSLQKLLNPEVLEIIDTTIPFYAQNRFYRSLGFRYKVGPLIRAINKYIKDKLIGHYDAIWVDKAVFIEPSTTSMLKAVSPLLIHFTPDPAFTFHRSSYFFNSIQYYDYLVTTKSYELKYYHKFIDPAKVIYATQGYDKSIHLPTHSFDEKQIGVVFIGHYEKERETLLQALINAEIPVGLAGINWKPFVRKNRQLPFLKYLGNGIYKEEYSQVVSSYMFGLGLLSKWVPELHTTRTFEIPACGTALLTEKNLETASFFKEDEAIFYSSTDELIGNIKYYLNNLEQLKKITSSGNRSVHLNGFDYESILRNILFKLPFNKPFVLK